MIPSAAILINNGELIPSCIGEEVDQVWLLHLTKGSSIPKPDYMAGLTKDGFAEEQQEKLDQAGAKVTERIYCPFLICEAKSSSTPIQAADNQNTHSAGVAVMTIVDLYRKAFRDDDPRVQKLYSQVLVFSISHDAEFFRVHGHYAIKTENRVEYRRCRIYETKILSSSWWSYNFVMNLYEEFAKDHYQRILEVAKYLPTVAQSQQPPPSKSVSMSEIKMLIVDKFNDLEKEINELEKRINEAQGLGDGRSEWVSVDEWASSGDIPYLDFNSILLEK